MSRRLIATLVAVLVVLSVGTVVVVASRHTSATTPSSEGTEVEPRGGESAREEAEEQAEELRPEAGVARVHNVASAPAAGWQAEQVWSTTANDWEPAIAADPVGNWVYQATTRYGGPKACQQCPDPRSSFGARATVASPGARTGTSVRARTSKRRTTRNSPSRRTAPSTRPG